MIMTTDRKKKTSWTRKLSGCKEKNRSPSHEKKIESDSTMKLSNSNNETENNSRVRYVSQASFQRHRNEYNSHILIEDLAGCTEATRMRISSASKEPREYEKSVSWSSQNSAPLYHDDEPYGSTKRKTIHSKSTLPRQFKVFCCWKLSI